MMAAAENIFEHVVRDAVDEEFTELLALNGVRIERIVSTGQTSPPEFWYDQAWSEWVRSCCTVRLVNALRPTHALSLGNADGLRSSKLKHPVQRMNSDGGFRHATLVRPRAQCISHHSFQAADR